MGGFRAAIISRILPELTQNPLENRQVFEKLSSFRRLLSAPYRKWEGGIWRSTPATVHLCGQKPLSWQVRGIFKDFWLLLDPY